MKQLRVFRDDIMYAVLSTLGGLYFDQVKSMPGLIPGLSSFRCTRCFDMIMQNGRSQCRLRLVPTIS